jgi:hypothetical protein
VNDKPSRHESRAASKAEAKTEARAQEAAAIRRRWITLGEAVAVIAVIISGLTLWTNWSDRHDSDVAKHEDAQKATTRASTLLLVASTSGSHDLALKPASAEQSVQSQTITFPTPLGVSPVETSSDPRIEAGWFDHALKKAREDAGLPDDSRGDEHLPVAITTHFLVDGEAHDDVAIYDIGYSITGHLLGGHTITLRGVSLVSRVKGGAQSRLDARWSKVLPHK